MECQPASCPTKIYWIYLAEQFWPLSGLQFVFELIENIYSRSATLYSSLYIYHKGPAEDGKFLLKFSPFLSSVWWTNKKSCEKRYAPDNPIYIRRLRKNDKATYFLSHPNSSFFPLDKF